MTISLTIFVLSICILPMCVLSYCSGHPIVRTLIFVIDEEQINQIWLEKNESQKNGSQSSLTQIGAANDVDYDMQEHFYYWTDRDSKSIKKSILFYRDHNGSSVENVITNLESPDGIAIHWNSRAIYWTDNKARTIEMADLGNVKNRKVLISDNLTFPRALAVSQAYCSIFWSDLNGNRSKIESSALDGENRRILVNDDIVTPIEIALDVYDNKLYWSDSTLGTIERIELDGTNRELILERNGISILGLTVFNNYIYYTDSTSANTVERIDKTTSNLTTPLTWNDTNWRDIKTVKAFEINPQRILKFDCPKTVTF